MAELNGSEQQGNYATPCDLSQQIKVKADYYTLHALYVVMNQPFWMALEVVEQP